MEENGFTTATIPSDTSAAATAATPEPSGEGLQEAAFSLPVKFNKQDYHLSMEEATAYAQKGMKFDTIEPMLDKLKTLAQSHGLGVRELVDALCEEGPSCAPDGETPPGEEQSTLEERMAEEFCRLREEVPDIGEFAAIPDTVVKTTVEEGVPLLDAYLRYEHRERMRIQAAQATAHKMGEASAGTQRGEPVPIPDPAVAAMLAGVRGA